MIRDERLHDRKVRGVRSGVMIGKRVMDEVSTFTGIFCKRTHAGLWRRDEKGYRVWIFDLFMLKPPEYHIIKDLADHTFNKRTMEFTYFDYTDYRDYARQFPEQEDIEVTEFDNATQFVKSLMTGEMFGFEAVVMQIYRMYPSLYPKITTISDVSKYGKLHKTVKSKFTDDGAGFVSRNVSGDRVLFHLSRIRSSINLDSGTFSSNGQSLASRPYIDIKTLLSELEAIKAIMVPPSSREGKELSFDIGDIRENEDERSRVCILTENQKSPNLKLCLSTKRKIYLTTCGDELDGLSIKELKEIHNFLATSGKGSSCVYTRNHYIDKIMLRIVRAVDEQESKRDSKKERTAGGREYMSDVYQTAR